MDWPWYMVGRILIIYTFAVFRAFMKAFRCRSPLLWYLWKHVFPYVEQQMLELILRYRVGKACIDDIFRLCSHDTDILVYITFPSDTETNDNEQHWYLFIVPSMHSYPASSHIGQQTSNRWPRSKTDWDLNSTRGQLCNPSGEPFQTKHTQVVCGIWIRVIWVSRIIMIPADMGWSGVSKDDVL
jgi:hypothetical protein